MGPDFADVDIKRAQALAKQGALVPLLLLPVEFGGKNIPQNVVYVPPFAFGEKRRIDLEIVAKLAKEGRVTQYEAIPEYQGASAVPIAIRVRASQPGDFTAQIIIWGDALKREQPKK